MIPYSFCGMVDRRKAFSLISSRGHCQRSSLSRISDTPRAGFEPAQNLSSGLVKWRCAVVITTTPRRHDWYFINWYFINYERWIHIKTMTSMKYRRNINDEFSMCFFMSFRCRIDVATNITVWRSTPSCFYFLIWYFLL